MADIEFWSHIFLHHGSSRHDFLKKHADLGLSMLQNDDTYENLERSGRLPNIVKALIKDYEEILATSDGVPHPDVEENLNSIKSI